MTDEELLALFHFDLPVWVLSDMAVDVGKHGFIGSVVLVRSASHGQSMMLFTEAETAEAYVRGSGRPNWAIAPLDDWLQLEVILTSLTPIGLDHVCIDHPPLDRSERYRAIFHKPDLLLGYVRSRKAR